MRVDHGSHSMQWLQFVKGYSDHIRVAHELAIPLAERRVSFHAPRVNRGGDWLWCPAIRADRVCAHGEFEPLSLMQHSILHLAIWPDACLVPLLLSAIRKTLDPAYFADAVICAPARMVKVLPSDCWAGARVIAAILPGSQCTGRASR